MTPAKWCWIPHTHQLLEKKTTPGGTSIIPSKSSCIGALLNSGWMPGGRTEDKNYLPCGRNLAQYYDNNHGWFAYSFIQSCNNIEYLLHVRHCAGWGDSAGKTDLPLLNYCLVGEKLLINYAQKVEPRVLPAFCPICPLCLAASWFAILENTINAIGK